MLNIWRYLDGKPGHVKQTAGLIQGFRVICDDVNAIDIEPALRFSKATLDKLYGDSPPALHIGAGHGIHLPMLRCRLAYGGKTVVLMKPSLPTTLFNLVVIPNHDHCSNYGNVITSRGPLLPVTVSHKQPHSGLILVGGASKYFAWSGEELKNKIEDIAAHTPEVNWEVYNSRRTPDGWLSTLSELPNLTLRGREAVASDHLEHALATATYAWVTEDSISMTYECIHNRVRTGLLPMSGKENRQNKVRDAMEDLVESKLASRYDENSPLPQAVEFIRENENERVAGLVFNRLVSNGR